MTTGYTHKLRETRGINGGTCTQTCVMGIAFEFYTRTSHVKPHCLRGILSASCQLEARRNPKTLLPKQTCTIDPSSLQSSRLVCSV